MSKLAQIVMKNFKELIDNKLSLFILVLGPLIIISLLGIYYYSDNSYSINLGVYGDNNSELLPIYIQGFKDNGFNVINYNSILECEDAIKGGLVHACIIFPNDFELVENKTNIVKVEVDQSKGKIVNLLEHSIYISIEAQNQKIQLEQIDMLINSVERTESSVGVWRENLSMSKAIILKLGKNNDEMRKNILELEEIYSSKDLGVEDITKDITKTNSSLDSFINSTSSLVLEIKNDISNVSALLDSGNVSGSDVSNIESLISDAKSLTISVEKKLKSMNSDKSDINDLVSQISDLEDKLSELESELNSKYAVMKTNLQNEKTEQKNLENTLNGIDNSALDLLNDLNKIEIRDSEVLVKPVVVEVSNVSSKANNRLTAIFPSLIASLIMIISLFIASTFVLQERNSEASFRNYMSQTSGFLFLIGNFIALFLIVFLQMSIIIFVYYLIFLKVSFSKALLVILITIPIITFFILLGYFIGNISKSETVNSIYLFVLIFCFLTFSGVLLPIESLSHLFQKLSMLNPYIISEAILRKIIIFEVTFKSVSMQVIILSILAFLFFILNLIVDSFNKKGKLYHYFIYVRLRVKEKILDFIDYLKSKFKKKDKKEN